MSYPRLTNYSGIRSSGLPFIKADGTYDEQIFIKQARYPQMTMDINVILLHPDIVLKMRQHNPKVLIFGYALMTHWWLDPSFTPQPSDNSFNARWHNAIKNTGGFIVNPSSGYEVDWSKHETAHALTELLAEAARSQLFDGFFLDYCSPVVSWVPQGNKYTDEIRLRYFRELADRMLSVDAGGLYFIIYGNGTGANQLGLNGTMAEGFPGSITPFNKALQLKPGDWLKAEGSGMGDDRIARYVTGTACLCGAYSTYGTSHYTLDPYDGTWWFPEYSVNPDGTPDPTGNHIGWLGEPQGNSVVIDKGVHFRMFDNGAVLVNPGSAMSVIDVMHPNRWKAVGMAQPQRLFNVPSQDAVFLISTL